MTARSTRPAGAGRRHRRSSAGGAGGATERSRLLALLAGLSVLAILILIAYSTTKEAWPIFTDDAAEFLFTTPMGAQRRQVRQPGVRLRHARDVDRSPWCFAVPLSIGIALFMTEVAPALAASGRSCRVLDLLGRRAVGRVRPVGRPRAGRPDQGLLRPASATCSPRSRCIGQLFEGPTSGRSFFTAGLILAIMIMPIITSLTREVFDTTPVDREGGGARPRARPAGR